MIIPWSEQIELYHQVFFQLLVSQLAHSANKQLPTRKKSEVLHHTTKKEQLYDPQF